MTENTDVFHIMYTCRSMRRLKPDPVPEELIYKVLEAGTQAPSGGGVQAWRFVVVTEPEIKKKIAEIYLRASYLAEHLAEAPVHLFACLRARKIHLKRLASPNAVNFARIMGGSIYPAVQNILLACRALGLGATLTSVTSQYDEEVRPILGLPDFLSTYALIPIGYPMGKFGPVTRAPVEQVTWHNQYGTPFPNPTKTE
jgi:nitroreductase